MKAVTQEKCGGPESLRLRDVGEPVPGAGELLVRVRAASVNAADWHIMRGDPWVARLMAPALGLTAPKATIRGRDFAGEVISAGSTDSADGAGPAPRLVPADEAFWDLGFA